MNLPVMAFRFFTLLRSVQKDMVGGVEPLDSRLRGNDGCDAPFPSPLDSVFRRNDVVMHISPLGIKGRFFLCFSPEWFAFGGGF